MSDSMHDLLIGVDGGGTGCRAAIGTSADGILAQASGGRANYASDPELTVQNVLATIWSAARKAGVSSDTLPRATAHVGLAGAMTAQDRARVASAMPFEVTTVSDDRPTAIAGALGEQDGFLLSIGTGTFAAASKAGNIRYVGGWGFQVGDQASGAWLGRLSLERVLLCHDGLYAHTHLTQHLFARFDNDPDAIVAFSKTAKPGDFGTFAPDIVAGAQDGDAWGQSALAAGADYLARTLTTLGFQPGDALCLSGGLGPHYAAHLPPDFLKGRIDARGNALDGAFQLAMSGKQAS